MRLQLLALFIASAAAAEPPRMQQSPPMPSPMPPQNCDYEERIATSREAFDQGMYAKSLANAEMALRCNPKPEAILQAAVAACELGNIPKRRLYVPKLGFVDKALFLIRTKSCTLDVPDVD